MTAAELIALLQALPPNAIVVVTGSEGDGYDDIGDVQIREQVCRSKHGGWRDSCDASPDPVVILS